MIGRTLGRFRIVRKIGQGGMASVWEARDELLGRAVAIKTLSDALLALPDARRRFLHEARAAALLDHPAIAQVFDAGESGGITYIALALVDGMTLTERVERSLLPVPEAVRIAATVADALDHAHARGVIHRDVTGRNIMLANDGRVFVLDFGLALVVGVSRVTPTGDTLGTVNYMAPEIARGHEADARSDLYSLGVVLFEALTGAFPFVGDRPEARIYAAINRAPRSVRALRPEVPQAIDTLVMQALAREPEDRPSSAAAWADALRAAIGSATSVPIRPLFEAGVGPAQSDNPDLRPTYLAVLPFEDVLDATVPEGTSTLSQELRRAIGAALATLPGLRVIPPGPEDARAANWSEFAAARGANQLLRGTIRRDGTSVRIELGLVDPCENRSLTSAVAEGSSLDRFGLEDRAIAAALAMVGHAAPALGHPRSEDPAARERFQQALGYLQRFDVEASIDGAITILERLALGPSPAAEVHAAQARAYLYKYRLTSERSWESKAATCCSKALDIDPRLPQARIVRADLHTSSGRIVDAIADYASALAMAPSLAEGWLGLARAHMAAQQYADAEAACRRAIRLRPRDWRPHSLLGVVFAAQGQYRQALAPWRRVVRLTPDSPEALSHLGSALYHLDRFEDAATTYRRSLEIQPRASVLSNLGTVLFYLGRHDEAIDAFERATRLQPSDALVWGNLGCALRRAPGHEGAHIEPLRRAIELMRERLARHPLEAELWARLAGWLANLGEREEARIAVEHSVSLAPADVYCMATAAAVFAQLGQREPALRWVQRAVSHGYGVERLRRDPELEHMNGDPDFEAVLTVPTEAAGTPGSTPHEPTEDSDGREEASA